MKSIVTAVIMHSSQY